MKLNRTALYQIESQPSQIESRTVDKLRYKSNHNLDLLTAERMFGPDVWPRNGFAKKQRQAVRISNGTADIVDATVCALTEIRGPQQSPSCIPASESQKATNDWSEIERYCFLAK